MRPEDPRPEERLEYPSLGRNSATLDADTKAACFMREIEHVLVHSSTIKHIDLDVAMELVARKRKRMSFAPMVITTGNLMAFETVKLLLGRTPSADFRGYFFNPWEHAHGAPGVGDHRRTQALRSAPLPCEDAAWMI